ncbi:alpha amylase, catalytic region [Chlorobium phaeobacteroides DSM 266]|uniref:Alpha amylase, catalytic region n=2 Tax=Chlorobium phaeobacteroides TaxID=1096 RepID=A1BEA1_CHLPD|nr:alpha amylase, catalytic region [Chlorobium phaeobacteroides DSM 266]
MNCSVFSEGVAIFRTELQHPSYQLLMFPLVFEINTRIWLQKLSDQHQKNITLATVPDTEFTFFSECGFDIVWLMGVWTPSRYSKAIATAHPGLRSSFLSYHDPLDPDTIVSSPYAIPSYTVHDKLGGKDELLAFREKLNALGILLMLDFVPNHLALDNDWLPNHPEYFIPVSKDEQSQDPESCFEYAAGKYLAHGKDPYFPSWTDTLQLNYANPATREMMRENLLMISSLCDGVRCDVAMLILKEIFNTTWSNLSGHMEDEFWLEAIAAVKNRFPDFIFLAEAYWNKEWDLQQLGFDFTYDMPFYDHLTHAPVNVEKLMGHMQAQWEYQQHLCRFIENHDEPRAAEKIGLNNAVAALVLLTAPGMHLIHENQMDGYKKKIPVQLNRQEPEAGDAELHLLYRRLFQLQKKAVFREGNIEWLHLNIIRAAHCFGYHRYRNEEHAFILANFSATGISIAFSHPFLLNKNNNNLTILCTSCRDKTPEILLDGETMHIRLAPHEGVVVTC